MSLSMLAVIQRLIFLSYHLVTQKSSGVSQYFRVLEQIHCKLRNDMHNRVYIPVIPKFLFVSV